MYSNGKNQLKESNGKKATTTNNIKITKYIHDNNEKKNIYNKLNTPNTGIERKKSVKQKEKQKWH